MKTIKVNGVNRKYYEADGSAFYIGRGLFKVFEHDPYYYKPYSHCSGCHLIGSKTCPKMLCHASDRPDNKNIQFVAL